MCCYCDEVGDVLFFGVDSLLSIYHIHHNPSIYKVVNATPKTRVRAKLPPYVCTVALLRIPLFTTVIPESTNK